MRILLVNPSWKSLVARDRRFNRPWPPLDLLNCAAILREGGHEVRLIDERADPEAAVQIQSHAAWAGAILLTSSPLDRWQCPNLDLEPFLSLVNQLPKEKLIICGAHGTVDAEKMLTLTKAAAVIRGEPEAAVFDFLKRGRWEKSQGISSIHDGIVKHSPLPQSLDLNALPRPAYDLVDPAQYYYEILGARMALLEGSRGCPHTCPFCFKVMYGQTFRPKAVGHMIEEVDLVVNSHGFRCVYFIDLEFAFQRDRVIELCQKLISRELTIPWACQTRLDSLDEGLLELMSRAGCRLIHIGIESGEESTQKSLNKAIDAPWARRIIRAAHRHHIATACFYLFGHLDETRAERKKTLDLALSLNSTYASFHELTPYPSTAVFDLAFAQGTFFPEHLPSPDPIEARQWAKRAFFRYYIRPGHMMRILRFIVRGGGLFKKLRLFRGYLR